MTTRTVSARIDLAVTEPADLVWSVAVAGTNDIRSELLSITVDGVEQEVEEIAGPVGTRLHRVRSAAVGALALAYDATVGEAPAAAEVTPYDEVRFLRPSRYCDSDRLAAVAATHFGDLTGEDLVRGATQWILDNIVYAPGSTGPVDGALEAYLHRQGVCRDSSQLLITFLRARGLPARLVSCYAPGLVPMDFHALTEVLLEGAWYVLDGTGLAPRPALVRIATGRDAADTAFLTVQSGRAALGTMVVNAVVDPEPGSDEGVLPVDDGITLTPIR